MARRRVLLLADRTRPEVTEVLEEVRAVLAAHVEIVRELDAGNDPLPEDLEADLAVAVGGDGTLISQARRIVDCDLPLIGVNVGRFGFLAEFDAAGLAEHAGVIFSPDPPVLERTLLDIEVRTPGRGAPRRNLAANDCVISAGPPFRMIELRLSIDRAEGPTLTGDGVIVATPVGSTAYNVSAGGPIVSPEVEAIVITPLAAHSLAFRPIVMRDASALRLEMVKTNRGTTAVYDGQVSAALRPGDVVEIRKHAKKARFVHNPATTYWRILQDKLRWAAPPTYRASVQSPP